MPTAYSLFAPSDPIARFARFAQFTRRAVAALALGFFSHASLSQAQVLPREVDAALARAKVPREAVTMLVADVDEQRPPRLAWRSQEKVNPASVMKLVTTYAALDLLGSAFTWSTPVYVEGPIQGNTLEGNLYIKGSGDPTLVLERLWLLLRRVQGLGIKTINGDIVLDRSAFDTGEPDPGAFDGRPLKSYNAGADALLINFKSVVMTFMPDPNGQLAHVTYDPPLAGVTTQATVPIAPSASGGCGDWRTQLRADFKATRMQFGGSFPSGCGELTWALAYPEPRSFAARAIGGMWGEMGGQIKGQVREGRVPAGLTAVFEASSPPLAEVIRDINKYSNNVMADQLFLTLGLQSKRKGNFDSARATVRQWWNDRIGTGQGQPVIDNGSGLSLEGRVTAEGLGRMLQVAWRSPAMPELMSSLPIVGVDGTLRKRALRSGAAAHLKSGTMPEAGVAGVAGYVDGASGRRYVLVAIANHANAAAARNAFDALVDWTAQDN
ncbi:D-alanyl-D-alanine carboxypeptidase/D-alanyl-D-alanine-endopeptidase [Variovorax sp. J22R133]|uniref:D-alanyl-D-alanine carboxypeptidase/D-alanyl-D-alanine endopeptidase n=1 Tax=Variovorax brevis TaxID=3053503 RepID=UPI002578B3E5|nr:D-alanyl-D-alanine carboxypeptidase/D-alanyl-D-alanine-endopeptidase [Variovorax sp. J22R133]MDM0115369.1 D-alanyl-D-alanine carboxypeptidase/D-alanyl-D-alanine-endopeptidase [Variovorax sp. J22R133]